ncbi:MAG: 2-desacetyl-2-hydroxyethyl bacteriochlorophyllide dehydrogenase [Enterovirga sp.]|jgi:acryloyl-coenzyme A reductase|nr:2-desacetyl-2-hydroxyethyl bacteriochlorophyllide dehydrogenase [Enterovirga sp.]
MLAMILPAYGGPEVFRCEDVTAPEPRPDQMLVRVAACGVCGHDVLKRQGAFPDTRLPCVIGHEIAGTVERVGALVSRFKPGDRVALSQRLSCGACEQCRAGRDNLCRSGPNFYGEGPSGGYGQYVVASERNAVRLPDTIPLEVGAVLSCALGTGFHALGRARLRAGDTVAITAASGGVGIHTVKLARMMGLRVIALSTASTKSDRLRKAGADEVVVDEGHAFHGTLKGLTGGAGVDAVIEIAGSSTFGASVRSLKPGGRLVVVGNLHPGNVPLNPAVSILKEIEIIGSAHATAADLAQIVELVARGRIAPEIGGTYPISEVAAVHEAMAARKAVGRLVLTHP